MTTLDPAVVARSFRDELRTEITALGEPLVLVGLLTADHGPSKTYAEYTQRGCDDVGVRFDLRHVARLDMERAILDCNEDPAVHGVIIYYPVFATDHDQYLRDLVEPGKDIEGLHTVWARCLYANRRFVDAGNTQKAILPCTPLAVVKLLDAAGGVFDATKKRPLDGRRACVFNRSEVVGRPLASMLANDGASVVSFDVDGPMLFEPAPDAREAHTIRETDVTRKQALATADVVITGVPSRSFSPIAASELDARCVALNFSTLKNFEADVERHVRVFVPRVGPMTVTMALRNTVRLHQNRAAR